MHTSAISDTETTFERLIQTNFDPVRYINDVLPTLTLGSQNTSASKSNRAAILQNASTEAQAFLTKLNTHNIRSSSELTTLTDDILRNGNRLAYEVEVLRGDANNLYDLLTETLKEDIAQFVTTGTTDEAHYVANQSSDAKGEMRDVTEEEQGRVENAADKPREPDFIRQLRILGLIKARLESVISLFGEAMKWPVASADVSVSSLISVSAPEYGIINSANDDKARQYTQKLRAEVTELLDSEGGGYSGLEAAIKRVNELKRLVQLWKDTSEEKARIRVVESLSKIVEDRKKLLDARSTPVQSSHEGSSIRSSSIPGRAGRIVEGSTNTAAGLFRKLRDEIYLE